MVFKSIVLGVIIMMVIYMRPLIGNWVFFATQFFLFICSSLNWGKMNLIYKDPLFSSKLVLKGTNVFFNVHPRCIPQNICRFCG